MSRVLNIIAVIIPVTLVVIIGTYVYYLFVYKPTPTAKIQNTVPTKALISLTPTRVRGRLPIGTSALVSSFLTYNHEGQITEIDNTPGIAKKLNNFAYKKKLVIKGAGEEPSSIFFNDQMLNVAKVISQSGEEKPIEDLKVGDLVKMQMVWKYNSQTLNYNILTKAEIKL